MTRQPRSASAATGLTTLAAFFAAFACAALLAACAGDPANSRRPGAAPPPEPTTARAATLQRTANGVAHISAPDFEALAYGMAYAYAQDNVCMTANHLVTVRGERSRHFGAAAVSVLGLRPFPNELIDFFIAAHMDDAALVRAAAAQSAEARALSRGYVAGYNRYLADHAGRLPAACNNAAWVRPMTEAEYRRIGEVTAVQAGVALMADSLLGAAPPKPVGATSSLPPGPSVRAAVDTEVHTHVDTRVETRVDVAAAAAYMREIGLTEPALGSNAWAFGRESTRSGHGLLLGNPHFPWRGVNRFWQVHLTVPGQLDVMGVAIGTSAGVVIGFNKDIAWTHTVSTGKRFTLHELTLVPGDPTSYLVDGQPEKMRSRTVSIESAGGERKTQTLWSTRYGPVIAMPRAGLGWGLQRAYALQDANAGNTRLADASLGLARATSVHDMRIALAGLGTPWVNTIAADRHGNAFYADASVVPDVDAAMLQRCAPSEGARRLFAGAGLVVLNGSRSDCQWQRDPASPVPGLTPMARLPVAVRSDWVQNSNDSFFHTHPAQRFGSISPLVGDDVVRRMRTRAGLAELQEMLASGPATLQGVQRQLFANRNTAALHVMPDLLAACAAGNLPTPEATDGCAALRGWDRTNNIASRGAHLFHEFWRSASALQKVWRIAADKARPVDTPSGLNMADAEVAPKVWEALAAAVKKVRAAGIALDAPWGEVQRPAITEEAIALHGGHDREGVLNNLGDSVGAGVVAGSGGRDGTRGIRIDAGTSYVQTVTFDARGPVAEALLTYGQSTDPASAHAFDQLRLYSRKEWPRLPFHADEVERARVGPITRLVVR